MDDIMTTAEGVAVLCLLMAGADRVFKQEELASMLNNPFFLEHVSEKLGPHDEFLQQFLAARKTLGTEELEKKAITALKSAFPTFKVKTLATMTLIAGADDDYTQPEKELAARVATALKVDFKEVQQEIEKMRQAHTKGAEK